MFYIMTKNGLRPTTKRKALLHAGRTAQHAEDIGKTVIGPPNTNFKALAEDVYRGCSRRSFATRPMTAAQSKVYLHARLHARKLSVGMAAIKQLINISKSRNTIYRVIDTRKSKWLIQCVIDCSIKRKFLVARLQDRSVWVREVPRTINNCLDALEHYRERFRNIEFRVGKLQDRRQGGDRRKAL